MFVLVATSKQKLKKQISFSSGNDYHYKKISYILEGQETKEYFYLAIFRV